MYMYLLSVCGEHTRGSSQYLWDVDIPGNLNFLIYVLSLFYKIYQGTCVIFVIRLKKLS